MAKSRPYFRNGRQKQIWTVKVKKNGRLNSIDIFHFICLPQIIYTRSFSWLNTFIFEMFKNKFKNNKNAYHENVDFYNTTHMRHRHFGSSMNKNGGLKFISPAKKILDWLAIFFLYFEPCNILILKYCIVFNFIFNIKV
jgi:hypothetical protein